MIKYLLEEIEKSPNPVFSKRELLSISEEGFQDLTKRRILTYFRPSEGDLEKVRLPRCQHGCSLTIVETDGELEAVCLQHPEEDPIRIEKDDLSRYALSVDNLLSEIVSANRINGKLHRLGGDCFYIGHKTYNSNRVGFIFIQTIGKGKLLKVSGLRHLCKDDVILVVFTPVSQTEDVALKNVFRQDRIVQTSFAASLNPQTFELPIDKLVSGLLKTKVGKEATITELSERQKEDYKRFEYQCYDKVHIPGTVPMKRSNEIVVNGNKVKLGDSIFGLFLRFVGELKRRKGGWVNIYSLEEEGIVTDPHKYQIYSNLRTVLEGSLLDKDGQKFIQNDGSKNYRTSIHPDFVTYDRGKLVNHPDPRVREIAEKLPQRGGRKV